MELIDLRSDTLTLPTPEMRRAMAAARLGDEGYGGDPTVRQLEGMAAEMTGKEAALLFVTGTQANLAALLTYCRRGHEIILGDLSHIFLLEAGGSAALGGIHPNPLPNLPDGTLSLSRIEEAIRPDDKHFCPTRLICIENSHMVCGGPVLTPAYTDAVGELARRHGLPVHLDGARIFNAAVSLGAEVRELTRGVDSLMFSLSKGLAAPLGALLCGPEDRIAEARRWRQMLGGGMHQAGVIAAAGIEGLNSMIPQLRQDNARARRFAEGISDIPSFKLDLSTVQTNIVLWSLASDRVTPEQIVARVEDRGVRIMWLGGRLLRAVTYYGITDADIERAVQGIGDVMSWLAV
jgi:threonine aldolase